jgi:hypothetical protein
MGRHGEYLATAARQQNLVAAHMPDQHAAIGDIGERNALSQVRAAWLVIVSHVVLP